MGRVESLFFDYIRRRIDEGALAVSAAEVTEAVVPAEFAQRAAYRHALERLHRRYVIKPITNRDGVLYYYLDDSAPMDEIWREINEK